MRSLVHKLYFKAKRVILQELNTMSIESEDPSIYQHQPDTVKAARRKVKRLFSSMTARLIEVVTRPVDNVVSQSIFIDPLLRLQQKNDKTPREVNLKS